MGIDARRSECNHDMFCRSCGLLRVAGLTREAVDVARLLSTDEALSFWVVVTISNFFWTLKTPPQKKE